MLLATILFCLGALNISALPVEKNVNTRGDISYLLPDNAILPENYKVTIDVLDSFNNINKREFGGSVEITALVGVDIGFIKLHATQIEITSNITVEDDAGIDYYRTHTVDKERQFLIIELEKKLINGTNIIITIESYKGKLLDDAGVDGYGFFVRQYKQNGELKTVLATQFEATHARKAFPCFDEPKYKATFELTLKKPSDYKVISNMPSNDANDGSGVTEVTFPKTPKMSTYLLAFIVHEYKSISSPDNINYKVWSRPEAVDQTDWATDYVFKIVEDLNNFTGIKYDDCITKMDMVAIPDLWAIAMENWGLLTYSETDLLVDKDFSTNKDIQRIVSLISHEVAHQWFGNLVTFTWWSNAWLNEGFATYFEYHTTGNVLSKWEMEDQFVVEQQQNVFLDDSLQKSTPLTLEVYTPSEINSNFGSISYVKGGSVIRMMEHFLGSDIFKEGLQHYINQNRLENTEPQDLWSAFQDVIDKKKVNLDYPIEEIMSNWISQPGYPVINVTYDANAVLTFSQQRFFMNPDGNSRKAKDPRWFVPISYTTSKDLSFTNLKPNIWLTPNETVYSIATEGDFHYVIVNIQEAGYYRVNYDDLLWEKLAQALPEEEGKKIHHINKAQIVDDVMNLARAGLVDYKIAFKITDYLATETNYYPWYSAFQAFRFLLQRFPDTEDTGTELRGYFTNITQLLVKDKKFVDADETQVQIFNRVAALEWACNLGYEKCIKQAKDIYKAFKNENKPIPRNLRSIVYCTALRNGDKADWDFLWNKFVKSNSAAEKIGIINALGCSNDEKILNAFLLKSIDSDSGIRKQDALYVFTAVYTGSPKGVNVAFDFLNKQYNDMLNKYNGINDLEKGVLGLGSQLADKKKIEEFKKLLRGNEMFANFRDAAIETVDENVAWVEKYSEIIGTILYKKRTGETEGTAAGILANKYVIFVSLGFISIYSMFH